MKLWDDHPFQSCNPHASDQQSRAPSQILITEFGSDDSGRHAEWEVNSTFATVIYLLVFGQAIWWTYTEQFGAQNFKLQNINRTENQNFTTQSSGSLVYLKLWSKPITLIPDRPFNRDMETIGNIEQLRKGIRNYNSFWEWFSRGHVGYELPRFISRPLNSRVVKRISLARNSFSMNVPVISILRDDHLLPIMITTCLVESMKLSSPDSEQKES